EFEVDDALRAQLLTEDASDQLPTHFTCTRYYDGHLTVEFSPQVTEAPLAPDALLQALRRFTTGLADAFLPRAGEPRPGTPPENQALKSTVIDWAVEIESEARLLRSLRSEEGLALLARVAEEAPKLSAAPAEDLHEQLAAAARGLLDQAREPSRLSRWKELAAGRIPVFIYFEQYGILNSAIYLPQFLDQLRRDPNNPRVRTIYAMFKHAGLTAQEVFELGRDSVDERLPGVEIELESRSKGFQWFFSFNLIFLVESEEGHKDAVLLLDEPGLDLHPTAQQELVGFFEELAHFHQLLYTTHSPFLVPGEHLEWVRAVREDALGHSEVSMVGMWPDDRETMFPLQAAAGYAMVRNLFDGKKNLLVEDFSDYVYIQGFAMVLGAARRKTLPDDVYITPCGGTKHLGYLASLFLGHQVRPVILLDSDDAARTCQETLLSELYAGRQTSFILLGEVLGLGRCEMEDLVGENLLLPVLSRLLGRPLSIAGVDASLPLSDRIRQAAARQGIALPDGWKAEVARRLVGGWLEQSPGTMPADVLERAGTLMRVIGERFADPAILRP